MARKIKLAIGEYYHIYNRGVDKRDVFMDEDDYKRFTFLLFICNSDKSIEVRNYIKNGGETSVRSNTIVDIGAYCLMPNHFHLLIREKTENGISKFIQKVSTAYTMYFNQKMDRSGALFQGVFKSKHIDSDEYLKYMFSYIHLNPIKIIQPD